MTNVTSTPPALGGTSGVAVGAGPGLRLWTNEINLADHATTLTTGGYIVVYNIPADTWFSVENAEIVTTLDADATTERLDLGDSADDDEWVSNHSTATAGTNLTLIKRDGSAGFVNPSADTLRLKVTGDKLAGGTANATGIIRFCGFMCPMTRNAAADTV